MARKADTPENHIPDDQGGEAAPIETQRASAIEAIVSGRRRPAAVDENADGETDPEVLGTDPSDDPSDEPAAETAGDPAAPKGDEAPKADPAPEDPDVEIKVNGETRTMKLSEVVATAQKNLAGDQYLEETRRLLAEAKEMRRAEPAADPPPAANPAPDARSTADKTQDVLDNIDWKDLGEQVQYGEPDKVGEALRNAISTAMSAANVGGADVEEIVSQRVNEAVERRASQQSLQEEFNSAITAFGEKHTTIFEDDELGPYAAREFESMVKAELEAQAREGKPRRRFHEIAEDAAERTYQFVERLGGKVARPSADSDPKPGQVVVSLDTQRRERLKDQSAQPAARAAVQTGQREAPRPLTAEEARQKGVQETIAARQQRKGMGQ